MSTLFWQRRSPTASRARPSARPRHAAAGIADGAACTRGASHAAPAGRADARPDHWSSGADRAVRGEPVRHDLLPIYLQFGHRFSPAVSGMLLLPLTIGQVTAAMAGPPVLQRTGLPHPIPVIGMSISSAGLLLPGPAAAGHGAGDRAGELRHRPGDSVRSWVSTRSWCRP